MLKKQRKSKKEATRVDINGNMKSYTEINFTDILEYCKTNNCVAWLKDFCVEKSYLASYVNDEGEKIEEIITRRPTFVEIKKAFTIEFFPAIAPKDKAPKVSMYDLIDAL